MFVSAVRQSESALCLHGLSLICLPFRPPRSTELCVQHAPVPCAVQWVLISCLLLLSINRVYICQSQPPLPAWYPYVFVLCVCLSFCFAKKTTYTLFSRLYINALIYTVCFSLLTDCTCVTVSGSVHRLCIWRGFIPFMAE